MSPASALSRSTSLSWSSLPEPAAEPDRRRPRPPRRRRRRSALCSSLSPATAPSSAESEESSLLTETFFLAATFFAGAFVSGAAWNMGTGTAFARAGFTGASTSISGVVVVSWPVSSTASSLLALAALFLAGRLRAFFGSIAINIKSSSGY